MAEVVRYICTHRCIIHKCLIITNHFVDDGVPKLWEEVGQESLTLILQRAKDFAELLQFFLYLTLARTNKQLKITFYIQNLISILISNGYMVHVATLYYTYLCGVLFNKLLKVLSSNLTDIALYALQVEVSNLDLELTQNNEEI